jgi:hypothetical protein
MGDTFIASSDILSSLELAITVEYRFASPRTRPSKGVARSDPARKGRIVAVRHPEQVGARPAEDQDGAEHACRVDGRALRAGLRFGSTCPLRGPAGWVQLSTAKVELLRGPELRAVLDHQRPGGSLDETPEHVVL